jgi:hypothetical protein
MLFAALAKWQDQDGCEQAERGNGTADFPARLRARRPPKASCVEATTETSLRALMAAAL